LDLKKIIISTGSACDSVVNQLSHVIMAIKVPKKYASGTIRVSFGKNNTEDKVKIIADEIVKNKNI
jgi:cysteine desulfurase